MNNNCAFSFNKDSIYKTPLDDEIDLCLVRRGFAVARLYFINIAEIDIPKGVKVFDDTNKCQVQPLPNTQFFALCWTDSYTIYYNNELVMQLKTNREWSIHTNKSIDNKKKDL